MHVPSETETTVLNVTNGVATAIELTAKWNVYVNDDGAGPYISLHNLTKDEDYRCLSLDDDNQCGDDLSKYHWGFWNYATANIWLESELGADTDVETVLAWLAECLTEEARLKATHEG